MNLISIKEKSGSAMVDLAYEDKGAGNPIVFIHPWPLSKRSWDRQVQFFSDIGFRTVAYDRRGFGESSKGADDYDYDTLADDLESVLQALDLRNLTLVGLSMGGGEVARYLGKYGSSRVSRAVFIASVPPKFSKEAPKADAIRNDALAQMQMQILSDRKNFFKQQMQKFFATSPNIPASKDSHFVDRAFEETTLADTEALVRSIDTWRTDLTQDFEKIDIPTLIINGRCDQLTPVSMGEEIQQAVRGSTLSVIENASHGLAQTHAGAVNKVILEFIRE